MAAVQGVEAAREDEGAGRDVRVHHGARAVHAGREQHAAHASVALQQQGQGLHRRKHLLRHLALLWQARHVSRTGSRCAQVHVHFAARALEPGGCAVVRDQEGVGQQGQSQSRRHSILLGTVRWC